MAGPIKIEPIREAIRNMVEWSHSSKKPPTGLTERTPKPEDLITLAT